MSSSIWSNGQAKKLKIRMFRFLDLSWVEILTGYLEIDSVSMVIRVHDCSNDHLIPNCLTSSIGSVKQNNKLIEIPFRRIGRVELDESDKKIIYFWIGVDPISISCLSQEDTRQLSSILQLLEENNQITGNVDDKENRFGDDELNANFIKECLLNNPIALSTFLNNNQILITNILLKECTKITQQKQKENCFTVLKTVFSFFGKQIIEILIKDDNYQILLNALSWNPFNNNNINYYDEYIKLTNFANSLQISNEVLLKLYEQNAKIKFLRDVAASILIEIQTEKILQNIINENNQTILQLMCHCDMTFTKIVKLAESDPKTFLNVFVQIWDTFKNTSSNEDKAYIKQEFIKKMIEKNIHNMAIQAMHKLMKISQENEYQKVEMRCYEKWIQGFNPFISYNWQYSQEWMMKQSKYRISFICLIYYVLVNCKDDGLIESILQFVKFLIKPSQNRNYMNPKFMCYVYREFVSQIWEIMKNSTLLLQIYVDFVIKIYKVDQIRTRRVLIQNKVMQYLQNQIKKKAILICIIKLFDTFLQQKNLDIFIYLKNNEMFKELKEQYLRNRFSGNVINSCFKSMLKKYQNVTNSVITEKYFNEVLEIGNIIR